MKAKTIWMENEGRPDTYGEFIGDFSAGEGGGIFLQIACDSHFAVYVNGTLASFGAAADYPWYRLYHRADITKYCCGQNKIKILVWYCGIDSQTGIKGEAGLWFEIAQAGTVLLASGSHILSRRQICYRNEYRKLITSQLGLSFYYDNTVENGQPYLPSLESGNEYEFHLRKTGYLTLGERVPATWSRTGKGCPEESDRADDGGQGYPEESDRADDGGQGYLVDLGGETVGFLELAFFSPVEQELRIFYGEHLVEGQVPGKIGNREFSVEFKAKKGENQYLNPFRRLAGRYLQVFCRQPLEITYIGLRPTDTPVVERKRIFRDALLQKIYDVSVNTLKKCMHEHYEDCPWREQAMYALDSRNQMLCGYYAFEGYEYQRENLLFIAKGQRKDGLLSLCFPAGIDIPIPFFSLVYFMQVYDYVTHAGEGAWLKACEAEGQLAELLQEVKPVLDRILDAFQQRIDENGLIANFPYPCWNFYEWAEASDHGDEAGRTPEEPYTKQYDLILNCMYVYAGRLYEKLFGRKRTDIRMTKAIQRTFYNPERGLYRLSTDGEAYSQLGNSLAILIGLGTEELAEKLVRDRSLIPVTLSMNTFYYDALLEFGDTYKAFILADIRKKYGHMLEQGADTFWETEQGWQDFKGAGSLCHGWSAIPVYYLSVLTDIRHEL